MLEIFTAMSESELESVLTAYINSSNSDKVYSVLETATKIADKYEKDDNPETEFTFYNAVDIIGVCRRRLRQLDSDTFYPSID